MGKARRSGRTRASNRGSPVSRTTRAITNPTRSTEVRVNTASTNRATSGIPRTGAIVARVASRRSPNGTPDGHAVSHARHPRHRSRCVPISASSSGTSPSRSRRMSTRRPRGLSFSSSRFTYVGQACRQNPQCTQASSPAAALANGVPGIAQAGEAPAIALTFGVQNENASFHVAVGASGAWGASPRIPGLRMREGSNAVRNR